MAVIFWCGVDQFYPIDARCSLAVILCHPLDGKRLAAKQWRQQALQGFDLVRPACPA